MKNKMLTLLKALALCVGTATFLLTSLFCFHEWAYDIQHPHHDRIFRYVHQVKTGDVLESLALASATIGPSLKDRFPEVEAYTRLVFPPLSVRNVSEDISFNERRFGFADPAFLDIFNFPVAGGSDPHVLLDEPFSVLLTPSMAVKYFGATPAVGQTLRINDEADFVVKGVFENDVEMSHFQFGFIASFSSLESIRNNPVLSLQVPLSKQLENIGIAAFYNYVRLVPGSSPEELVAKFPAFIEETRGEGRSERLTPTLQAVTSIHLDSKLIYEIQPNGSRSETYIYLAVGVLILSIACINYINASTAEFISRQRTISLKKILGVSRTVLIGAHFVETIIIAVVSLLGGLLVAMLVLPDFNDISGRPVRLEPVLTTSLLFSVLLFIVLVSGIFPAIKIASVAPVDVVSGHRTSRRGSAVGRNALVFVQIVCSFSLLTLSLLLYTQFNYLLKRDVGFVSKNIIVINALTADPLKRISFRDRIVASTGVAKAALCSSPPGRSFASCGVRFREKAGDEDQPMSMWQSFVDHHYLDALTMGVIDGRFFDENVASDTGKHLVVNGAAAAVLGGTVIGRELNVPVLLRNRRVDKSVVGVVSDFHFASLHHPVEPLMLEYNPGRCGYILLRLEPGSANDAVALVAKSWKESFPAIPFDYYFLDSDIGLLYGKESRQKDLLTIISIISVGLAALGIFGTTLFLAEARTKEMGIRKVLGSARISLLVLLFRPNLIILVSACVIATPLTLLAGIRWLEQYPYRVAFSPTLFILSFAIILVIMALTVFKHFLKVANVNPVEVLRDKN
jgi:putative ABC transport system permease protein